MGGGGSTVGGGGGKSECPPVEAHRGFHRCSSVTRGEVVCAHKEGIRRDRRGGAALGMRALLSASGSD